MRKLLLSFVIFTLFFSASCKKEIINEYALEPVHVARGEGEKGTLKSDLQFISIAYADLFGKVISEQEKNLALQAYNSLGDKNIIIDRMIRALLLNPAVQIPSDIEMRNDPEAFITGTFKRLLTREPAELEKWYMVNAIKGNQTLTARDIYYVLLSCEEYRYY